MEIDQFILKFTPEELQLLEDHIREQRKIRRLSSEGKTKEELDEEIAFITEQVYFHNLDFITINNFHKDETKLKLVWQYLITRLSQPEKK